MRAALIGAWPGLSHHFHLHPWDIRSLSPAELSGYLEALDEINQANRKAARKG